MAEDEISINRFEIMERKLFWGLMTPGGILTILFGLLLIPSYGLPDWLKIKLFLIFLLVSLPLLFLFSSTNLIPR